MSIPAVFENGVFRPTGPVNLPDRSRVELEVRLPDAETPTAFGPGLQRAYAILKERYASGHSDVAERHNEHQP